MNPGPESPVGIVGSRDFPDLEMVRAFVRSLPRDACVVSGGARGVDQAAEAEAIRKGLSVLSLRPVRRNDQGYSILAIVQVPSKPTDSKLRPGLYPSFTKAAHVRNQMIVNESGSVAAFWDGESTGTKSTIDKAEAAGILFAVFTPDSVAPST